MLLRRICLLVMMMALISNAWSKVFHKDNPTPSEDERNEMVASQKDTGVINCQHSKSKSCKAHSKPIQITAFGDCQVVSMPRGNGLFIPVRSKKEWVNFKNWAVAHSNIVTLDSCSNPEWTAWSECTNTCGKGTKTRQCNRLPMKDGSLGCRGEAKQECSDFSTCTKPVAQGIN